MGQWPSTDPWAGLVDLLSRRIEGSRTRSSEASSCSSGTACCRPAAPLGVSLLSAFLEQQHDSAPVREGRGNVLSTTRSVPAARAGSSCLSVRSRSSAASDAGSAPPPCAGPRRWTGKTATTRAGASGCTASWSARLWHGTDCRQDLDRGGRAAAAPDPGGHRAAGHCECLLGAARGRGRRRSRPWQRYRVRRAGAVAPECRRTRAGS